MPVIPEQSGTISGPPPPQVGNALTRRYPIHVLMVALVRNISEPAVQTGRFLLNKERPST